MKRSISIFAVTTLVSGVLSGLVGAFSIPGVLFGIAIALAMKWVSPKAEDISLLTKIWFIMISAFIFFVAQIAATIMGIRLTEESAYYMSFSCAVGGLVGSALLAWSGIWLLHFSQPARVVVRSLFLGTTLGYLFGILFSEEAPIRSILAFTLWQSCFGAFFGFCFHQRKFPSKEQKSKDITDNVQFVRMASVIAIIIGILQLLLNGLSLNNGFFLGFDGSLWAGFSGRGLTPAGWFCGIISPAALCLCQCFILRIAYKLWRDATSAPSTLALQACYLFQLILYGLLHFVYWYNKDTSHWFVTNLRPNEIFGKGTDVHLHMYTLMWFSLIGLFPWGLIISLSLWKRFSVKKESVLKNTNKE